MMRLLLAGLTCLAFPLGLLAQEVEPAFVQRPLAEVLRAVEARTVPDASNPARAVLGDTAQTLVARLRTVYQEAGPTPYFLFQETSVASPLVGVGETLYLYNTEDQSVLRATVRTRSRVEGTCEGGFEHSGYAYELDRSAQDLFRMDADGYAEVSPSQWVALNHSLAFAPDQEVPAPIAASVAKARERMLGKIEAEIRKEYKDLFAEDKEASVRLKEGLYGAEGENGWDPAEIRVLRTSSGAQYALGFALSNPINSEEPTREFTLFFDAQGQSAGRAEVDISNAWVGDLDEDGQDEIVDFTTGVILKQKGREWVGSKRDQSDYSPCY